ncbi:hypothetical protein GCM10007049_12020 [Echinicola pacifica]|uniref:Capsule assembly protein Wzi n=2 Tax=Echinicola pacifica TaxID=346377 RepID=A0A918PS61_9BACT|nr:hypothetical protein GCM10007049_12020 [Echinicola pacifica]
MISNTTIYKFLLMGIVLVSGMASGQTINLNNPLMGEYLRRQQLIGNFSADYSFNLRPLSPRPEDLSNVSEEEAETFNAFLLDPKKDTLRGGGYIKAMPFTFRSQYNAEYAFGVNDGALIPNSGAQVLLSGGMYLQYKGLSIQLMPEIIAAQNLDYIGFPTFTDGYHWMDYYEWLNTSDIPERFGTGSYTRFLPGQSSIKYTYGGFSAGISTENLWWGPARRNSLLMSNNAPGFLHATIETARPFTTSIGAFEGQLVMGQLENSGFLPPNSTYVYKNSSPYIPKRDDWRYLAGITFSYQPKWVPGLSVGYSSVSQMYHNDMSKFADYLPIFNGAKGPADVIDVDRDKRNQLSSGFFRWMSHGGLFEFYGEYGSNGNSRMLRDFLVNPDLTRAFTFGFTSLIPLKGEDAYFQLSSEMTQMGQVVRETIFDYDSWYTHPHVRHGYTNKGQVLGAGIGPGSNVIFLEASYMKKFNRVGVQMERLVHNNDFYYKSFEIIKDYRRKYVDLVPSVVADWKIDKFLLSGKLQYISTLNYNWYLVNDPEEYFIPGFDRKNVVAHFSFVYLIE